MLTGFSIANTTIRTRIIAAFSVMFALLLGLGAIAITSTAAAHMEATRLQQDTLPSLKLLSDFRYLVARHRSIAARHVMQADASDKAKVDERLAKITEKFAATDQAYQKFADTGEESALYQRSKAAREAYLKLADEYLTMSRAGRAEEATRQFVGTVAEAALKAETTLDELVALNDRDALAAEARGQATYDEARTLAIGAIVIALLFALVAGWLLWRSVAVPVRGMTLAMTRLAQHDMTAAIPSIGRTNEIGRMADAVQVFKQAMIDADRLAAETAAEQVIKQRRADRMLALTSEFDHKVVALIGALSSASTEMEAAARSMSTTAGIASVQSASVAAASHETSSNVETVAAATEELAASIREITRQVNDSASFVERAVTRVHATRGSVRGLAESAKKIDSVIRLISEIASQTNLLALNATIEAARAGDAGRGFAIVAAEVKGLARQTADATEAISAQIIEIQEATTHAVVAIEEIGRMIEDISEISSAIAAAIQEQQAATAEITRNVLHAAEATQTVTQSIAEVQTASHGTTRDAEQVLGSANGVAQQAVILRSEVDGFLSEVRAA